MKFAALHGGASPGGAGQGVSGQREASPGGAGHGVPGGASSGELAMASVDRGRPALEELAIYIGNAQVSHVCIR